MGSSSKEATTSEWPLVRTFSQVHWSRDCQVVSEVRVNPSLPPKVLQFIQPQASGCSGGAGDMLGAVSCWPPEPLLWPLLAGPRPWGGNDSLPFSATFWQPRLPGMPSGGPVPIPPTTWPALGSWGPVGLGARLPQHWRLSRVSGPDPEGAAIWALTQPGLDPGG